MQKPRSPHTSFLLYLNLYLNPICSQDQESPGLENWRWKWSSNPCQLQPTTWWSLYVDHKVSMSPCVAQCFKSLAINMLFLGGFWRSACFSFTNILVEEIWDSLSHGLQVSNSSSRCSSWIKLVLRMNLNQTHACGCSEINNRSESAANTSKCQQIWDSGDAPMSWQNVGDSRDDGIGQRKEAMFCFKLDCFGVCFSHLPRCTSALLQVPWRLH